MISDNFAKIILKLEEMILRIILKITSGQMFTTVAIIYTLCLVYIKCIDLVAQGKMAIEVFLGLSNAFFGLAGSVITFYFVKDRKVQNDQFEQKNKQGENT